jgi:hypothetical protein
MPTDTKKKHINASFKGKILPIACLLYWESDIMTPAKRAPKAVDSPILEVKTADDKQMNTTLARNNCLLPVLPTKISRETEICRSE